MAKKLDELKARAERGRARQKKPAPAPAIDNKEYTDNLMNVLRFKAIIKRWSK